MLKEPLVPEILNQAKLDEDASFPGEAERFATTWNTTWHSSFVEEARPYFASHFSLLCLGPIRIIELILPPLLLLDRRAIVVVVLEILVVKHHGIHMIRMFFNHLQKSCRS